MVDFKFEAIQVSHHSEPSEVGLVEKISRKFVLVGESMCAISIQSATALSDVEEFARSSRFCMLVELYFQRLARPRNVECRLEI